MALRYEQEDLKYKIIYQKGHTQTVTKPVCSVYATFSTVSASLGFGLVYYNSAAFSLI